MDELLVISSLRAPTPFHTVYLSQRIASVVTEAIIPVISPSDASHAWCHASVDVVPACRFRCVPMSKNHEVHQIFGPLTDIS